VTPKNQVEMIDGMTTGSVWAMTPAAVGAQAEVSRRKRARRRRISPEAGRALEILGHAIEYLADEYVHRAQVLSAQDGPVEAMQLLMRVNRKIYLACPEVPSLADRWRTLLRVHAA